MEQINMHELISVVVPIYNVESFLPTCIDSIINQTYKNLEIILCDDGATDSCAEICDEYAAKDNRIRVIHKKNGGLSDARNAGIDIARGRYITFIDSDDYIEIDMIEYLYKIMLKHNADMVSCQRQTVDEVGNIIKKRKNYQDSIYQGNNNCMKAFLADYNMDTVAWGKLYKTSMFSDVRYPLGKYNEDVYTTYKIIAKCKIIIAGCEKKYNYRIRQTSIMNEHFSMKHLDGIEGAKIRAKFIEENYPSLIYLANASIVYSTNQCVNKIAKTKYKSIITHNIIKELQKNYREYEYDFLKGSSSIRAKIFSLICYLNLPLAIKILSI